MKRLNLRDVPDEVFAALSEGAEANRQSLNAFVVERLVEVAQVLSIADYVASYAHVAATRHITPYDAAYVALAEQLDSTLITCDAKLAAASGAKCAFDLIH